MRWPSFERIAGALAIVGGVGALAYAALFAAIVEGAGKRTVELWFALLLGGAILAIPVAIAVYARIRVTDEGFAMTSLLLGLLGALGGILHGGSNLARLLDAPGSGGPAVALDPVGILRYAAAGLASLLVGWLIMRGGTLPRGLGYLALFGGAVLIFIYVGRLFDFITPTNKVTLIPPFVFGFFAYPVYNFWLGRELWRGPDRGPTAMPLG